ncbi:MAG TPA: MBL fold metallo-hydrolase [Clostridiales bacterium]|nr:MBL fold metallo-hydrolase [Clostridiales bacterium]
MQVKTFVTDTFGSNFYIVSQNNTAIMIDPSGSSKLYQKAQDYLQSNNLQLKGILFTHGHFDHIALGHLYQGKAPMYIHKADSDMLYTEKNYGKLFGYLVKGFEADNLLNGDEQLTFDDIKVQVIHTPGHSQGSVCYIIDNYIFSGDTLFKESIGRTDLTGGNYDQIIQSINKLFELKGDYTVYSGHGEPTTLRYEQKNNPYV